MRRILPLAALLFAAGLAWGEQKVSGGDTPPASGQAAQSAQERAAAEKERRESAKKALEALKGKQDKRDERKPGGR